MSYGLFLFLIFLISFFFERVRSEWGRGGRYRRRRNYRDIHNVFSSNFLNARMEDRENALREAGPYLKPYSNIWANLELTNKYCSLKLGKDGVSITGHEKAYPNRFFRVVSTGVYTPDMLWNMWCKYFDFNKSYNGLLEDCSRFGIRIIERKASNVDNETQSSLKQDAPKTEAEKTVNKIDINNCSEAELTALPGISIVLAKKTVKKREEIGGFKNIEEFFMFIKLRPHMENQLRNLIEVKKMQGNLHKKLSKERSVDL